MISITSTDEKTARRVVATVTVDGREYERLAAIADTFNDWGRRGVGENPETDNTPATVYEGFFSHHYPLDEGLSREVSGWIRGAIDERDELLAEIDRAVEEADRRWEARRVNHAGQTAGILRGAPARL